MSDDLTRYFKPSEITPGKRELLQAILDRIAEVHRMVQKCWERYGIPTAEGTTYYRRSHA